MPGSDDDGTRRAPLLSPVFFRDRSVLVTGATGLLGSWLCAALTDVGANVVAVVRDDVPASNFFRQALLSRVSVVRGAVEDVLLLERALGEYEVECVFHLAAQTIVGVADRSPLSTFETNIRGTYNLLEAARRSVRVKRIVVASTDKAYGDRGRQPYTEEMSLEATAPYDLSKACADRLARGYFDFYRLPVAISRMGNLYGGGDLNWSRLIPGTLRSGLRGEKPVIRSDGRAVRDYVFVEDAVTAYGLLAEQMERPDVAGRAFNFSDEQPRAVVEVARAALAAIDRSDLDLVVENGASTEIPYQTLSARRAREVLSWAPRVTLQEGLARTAAWYRDHLTRTSGEA